MRKVILISAVLAAVTAVAEIRSIEPVAGTRDGWTGRFEEGKRLAGSGDYPVVFIGDDIVEGWRSPLLGGEVWQTNFAEGKYRALNLGIRGDRTENVLWRLRNGQLGKLRPRAIVLMAGANNLMDRTRRDESPLDTTFGIREIVRELQRLCPEATVIWTPILPQGTTKDAPERLRGGEVNHSFGCYVYRMGQGVERPRLVTCDFGWRCRCEDGSLNRNVLPDGVQLRKAGYLHWAEHLRPYLDYALAADESARPGRSPTLPESGRDDLRVVRDGKRSVLPKEPPRPRWAKDQTRITPRFAQVSKNWLTGGFNAKKKDFVPDERLLEKRRESVAMAGGEYDLVMIGDSITHFFEIRAGRPEWEKLCRGRKVLNLGFGGNTLRNALWNIREGGFLDNVRAKTVTLMIGTNNRGDTAEFVAEGIGEILAAIREKQPQARIVLHPLLPRVRPEMKELREKNDRVNRLIRSYADERNVLWVDLNPLYEAADETRLKELLPDGTHPGADGYRAWREALEKLL